jgi:hypothetical protein
MNRAIAALLLGIALLAAPLSASADSRDGRRARRGVPEFDASAVGAIAALVAGGGVLLARRRTKKP